MIFIVDLENVNSPGLHGANLLTASDTVVIFYGDRDDCVNREYMDQLQESGCRVEFVEVTLRRKNALDFYIVSYISEKLVVGTEKIVIISRDKDFESVRSYWELRNRNVNRAKDILSALAAYDEDRERSRRAERMLQSVHLRLKTEQANAADETQKPEKRDSIEIEYLHLQEISEQEFCDHVNEDNFCQVYGNPVIIKRNNGNKVIAIAWPLAERLLRAADCGDVADEIIRQVAEHRKTGDDSER